MASGELGLVLTGGGARGAYQAGALLALSEIVASRRLPFRLLSGSSAGSLNATYLASRADDFRAAARDLADLWGSLSPERIFRTDSFLLARKAAGWLADLGLGAWIGTGRGRALLDTTPLRALVGERFDPAALRRQFACGNVRAVAVTATNYQSGLATTFVDGDPAIGPWTRVTRVGVRSPLGVEHVLASSAIPIFFPAVALEGGWYADGSIRLSTPLSPAVHMGAGRVVAIAVRPGSVGEPRETAPAPLAYPTNADTAGLLLNALFLDALESDVERASRINQTLRLVPSELVANYATPLRHLDVLLLRPSVDPSALVLKALEHFPAAVRHLFRGLGASQSSGWDLLSYLGFEAVYTTRLMHLGYGDTLARADELRAFVGAG